jgi:hypothetical protein
VSQSAITGTRRMILTERIDPTTVMQALVDELKYVHTFIKRCTTSRNDASYKKRLALFYLFNDVIQVAARDRIQGYVEIGSNIFLPEVCIPVVI